MDCFFRFLSLSDGSDDNEWSHALFLCFSTRENFKGITSPAAGRGSPLGSLQDTKSVFVSIERISLLSVQP